MDFDNPSSWLGPSRIRSVVDKCYAAHIRVDGAGMAAPKIRDRVHVDGHDEVFFIVYVDARRRLADVVCGERVGFLSDVPFSQLRPAQDRRSRL